MRLEQDKQGFTFLKHLNNFSLSVCLWPSQTFYMQKQIFQQKYEIISCFPEYTTVGLTFKSFFETSLFFYTGTATRPASVRGLCNRLWRGSERRGALRFPADWRRQQGLGTLPHRCHIGSHHHDSEAGPRDARPAQRELSCMCAGLFCRRRFVHFCASQGVTLKVRMSLIFSLSLWPGTWASQCLMRPPSLYRSPYWTLMTMNQSSSNRRWECSSFLAFDGPVCNIYIS